MSTIGRVGDRMEVCQWGREDEEKGNKNRGWEGRNMGNKEIEG